MTPEEAADALDGAFFAETLSDRREELMTLQAFAREPRAMTPDGFVDKAELERRFKEQIVRLRAVACTTVAGAGAAAPGDDQGEHRGRVGGEGEARRRGAGAPEGGVMAKNTGRGRRTGSISGRTPTSATVDNIWTRPNTSSGLFMQSQRRGGAFRGLRLPWHLRLRRWLCQLVAHTPGRRDGRR